MFLRTADSIIKNGRKQRKTLPSSITKWSCCTRTHAPDNAFGANCATVPPAPLIHDIVFQLYNIIIMNEFEGDSPFDEVIIYLIRSFFRYVYCCSTSCINFGLWAARTVQIADGLMLFVRRRQSGGVPEPSDTVYQAEEAENCKCTDNKRSVHCTMANWIVLLGLQWSIPFRLISPMMEIHDEKNK